MKNIILKFSIFLFIGLFVTYWLFQLSSLNLPKDIPLGSDYNSAVKTDGIFQCILFLTVIIVALKRILKYNPEAGILKLTTAGLLIFISAEVAFHALRQTFIYADNLNERFYYFSIGVIAGSILGTVLSYFVAFQLKTKKTGKLILIIICFLVLIRIVQIFVPSILGPYEYNSNEPKDEFVIENIHLPRKPCISAMNDLLGKGADSNKVCECLIPMLYDLIKNDPLLVEKFKHSAGIIKLEGHLNDSLMLLFSSCVRANIVDSNYIIKLTPQYEIMFKEKFKEECQIHKEYSQFFTDAVTKHLVEKLYGNITIKEFFAEDYLKVPKIKQTLEECALIIKTKDPSKIQGKDYDFPLNKVKFH